MPLLSIYSIRCYTKVVFTKWTQIFYFMKVDRKQFLQFSWRVTSLHMISYFIAGVLALFFAGYKELFRSDILSVLMRPLDSSIVAAGPSLQIILGFFMSLFLFPFRSFVFSLFNVSNLRYHTPKAR